MATSASARSGLTARLGAVLAGALLGASLTLLASWSWAAPDDASAEAGFARDMATHHAQAVEMAFVVRDTSRDEALRTLAYDIIVTQSTQRGVFMGWLQQWGLPQSSPRARMAWMPGHDHPSAAAGAGLSRMPGMADDDELRRLREAQGVDAEVLFLQLMIRHHEGGVVMARAVAGLSRRPEVTGMAGSIDNGQRAEIDGMKEMLAARGAMPYPSLLE
jgi:uncharacterized protein (DUF305 family)